MAAIQYVASHVASHIDDEEEPARSAVVIPFPGAAARPADAGRAPGARGLGGAAAAAPTAARLPESVYRRRRLVAGSVAAAVLTVLLAVARPSEAPLEAVDPWSSLETASTGAGSSR